MARKRRRFTADFKKRLALEALRERDSVQAIAARHEVHPNQVRAWKRQAVERLDEVRSRLSRRSQRFASQKAQNPRSDGVRLPAKTIRQVTLVTSGLVKTPQLIVLLPSPSLVCLWKSTADPPQMVRVTAALRCRHSPGRMRLLLFSPGEVDQQLRQPDLSG